jgi:uncharacterized membrane protein (UPF0127 family)
MLSQRGKVVLKTRGGKELLLDVEIAANDRDRTRGLMFRRKMPEFSGMVFVFPVSSHLSFWMKNTLLPLDILFIDEAGLIVGVVENAEPKTLSPRQVEGASKLVLEVNSGFCARHGVRAGDTVELQGMYRLE